MTEVEAHNYVIDHLEQIYADPAGKHIRAVWYQINQQGMTEKLRAKLKQAVEDYLKTGVS